MARSTGGIGARRVGRLAALFGLCVGLAACAPPPRVGWQGQTPVLASYAAGVLSTELPMGVGVHSTIAAARMTLERRGYTITATEATDDTGRVVARPGDPALMRKITITARLRTTGTSVSIRTDPGGNEQYERDVLERMLTLLGL